MTFEKLVAGNATMWAGMWLGGASINDIIGATLLVLVTAPIIESIFDSRAVKLVGDGNSIPRPMKPKREPLNPWSIATALLIIGGLSTALWVGS